MEKERKQKKRFSVVILLVLLLGITIGFAALTASLNITGTSTISSASWDVHFQNIQVTTGSVTAVTAPTISANGLSISYEVALAEPGDFYEFKVDVKNAGSVAAKLSALPTLGGVDTAQDVYTNYTFTHGDGTAITTLANETLAAGATKTYKVRVEFDSNVNANQLPTSAQELTLTVGMSYEQA